MTSTPVFQPTWESLRQYTVPEWYKDAKFGIFIHWGVYSVPAFGNTWYPRHMYLPDMPEYEFHRKTFGPQDQFGYKDFIPLFKAEKFDPEAWADLFAQSGARFVMPVAEHHDGFCMYDTNLSRWNVAKMGPKRDVLGELSRAVRTRGMQLGVSSHRAEHWFFMNGGRLAPSDVQDPQYEDFYGPAALVPDIEEQHKDFEPHPHAAFLEDWLARSIELVDRYQPEIFWFDYWIEQTVFEPYLQRFAAYYYNKGLEWGKGVAINYKYSSFKEGTAVLDIERGQSGAIRPMLWQTDTSMSKNSWGYIRTNDYKTAASLIPDFVDIVSKNGVLLLNVGPRADGTIPEPEQDILREFGTWLKLNGEAIYNTRPWTVYGEGPTRVTEGAFSDTKRESYSTRDIRFTRKDNILYAAFLAWPGEQALIRLLHSSSSLKAEQIKQIRLLGLNEPIKWKQDDQGLHLQLPAQQVGKYAYVFKIECTDSL